MADGDVTTSEDEASYRKTRRTAVLIWAVIGAAIVFVLVMQALGMVNAALECLLVGIVVGFICSPITNFLEDHHVGRAGGALIALVIVLGIFVLVLVYLVPPFFEQLLNLLEHIPGYISQIQDMIRDLWDTYGDASNTDMQNNLQNVVSALSSVGTKMASDLASQISSGLIPNIMNMVNTLFMAFLGLVVAYWLARDYPKIVREFAVIAGPRRKSDLTLLFAVMSRSMGGYMRGILITSTVGGFLSFFGFVLIGHPYAGLMGIATGIMHFVPVIGPWCAAAVSCVVAFFTSPMLALESILVSIIAQNVTDNLVSPLVMQSAVKVHPVLSLMAITIGASLAGALGMALAIPLSAAIKGVFVYYFEARSGRQIVSYDGALFKGTPYHHPDGTPSPTYDALDDEHFFETSRLTAGETKPDVERTERPKSVKLSVADIVRKHAEDITEAAEKTVDESEGHDRDGGGSGTGE
ncbi:MAG: AI-2E family transporter [Atopobiaceae bacterium]|jgi:predicted PurR-regulated permease PerM|nr:AI-2E family transporter [Atopobiaceae bacterium]MCI2173424.1 AI-2E family transporter [Atopobiaceae bacterium]MCI2207419.1 AI-2E family transporter [Atopobiaceae bacterium]